MGMYEGRARIGRAIKDLMQHWMTTCGSWDDQNSRDFEKRFLQPLELDARQATSAMDHMAKILNQVKRDCQ